MGVAEALWATFIGIFFVWGLYFLFHDVGDDDHDDDDGFH